MNESDGFKANCYICKKNYTAQGLLGGKCVCNKCYTPWYAGIEIHLEENKKLKEDNEKAALIMAEFERFIKKEKEENNKLKEEIKELKDRLFSSKHEGNGKVSILQEENDELKEENEMIKIGTMSLVADLEAEIKKLKITDETCLNICELIEDELPKNYKHDDIIKYIKELKEENSNEKLKDTQKAMYDLTMSFSRQLSDASTTMIKYVEEINQLKEENEKLKEEIKHKNSKSHKK